MKERTYTKEEIMNMLKETEDILVNLYNKARDTGNKEEAERYWKTLLGCDFTIGSVQAQINAYEKGWK